MSPGIAKAAPRHEMTEARRHALELIAVRWRGGPAFESDVCSRSVALGMEQLGWIYRLPPSRRSRQTMIMLTDVGSWIIEGVDHERIPDWMRHPLDRKAGS